MGFLKTSHDNLALVVKCCAHYVFDEHLNFRFVMPSLVGNLSSTHLHLVPFNLSDLKECRLKHACT